MTPSWLQPMSWLQMQQGQGKSTGQGIVEGAGTLGSALISRKSDPQAPKPNLQIPQTTPTVQEPPIPVLPVPQYGARSTEYRAQNAESPLLQQRSKILNMLMGGGAA